MRARGRVRAPEPSLLPRTVCEVVRSEGRPLDPQTGPALEARFGHDFATVRVHADAPAAESARAVGADAYALGSHIVFGEGRYAPSSTRGRALLAHELAHVAQQRATGSGELSEAAAERDADAWAAHALDARSPLPAVVGARPTALHRDETTAPAPPAAMTRAKFEETMARRFGVPVVRTGTMEEQRDGLNRGGKTPAALPDWKEWDPGPASESYERIIESFDDFAATFGGAPVVTEIVFFDVAFDYNPASDVVTPKPGDIASFGAGQLTIYSSVETSAKGLPTGRSTAGTYTSVTTRGPAESRRRLVGHELGHGLAEAAMAADPTTFDAFRLEIGWWVAASGAEELFDMDDRWVRSALIGPMPVRPVADPITARNWLDAKWGQQPMSGYATQAAAEDFAESVMAFVYAPEVLRARSSRRYEFIDRRRHQWQPKLVPVLFGPGDYPLPEGETRVA